MRARVIGGQHKKHGDLDGDSKQSLFYGPTSLCLDDAGNVLVSGLHNSNVRKIDRNGITTTIAWRKTIELCCRTIIFDTKLGIYMSSLGGIYRIHNNVYSVINFSTFVHIAWIPIENERHIIAIDGHDGSFVLLNCFGRPAGSFGTPLLIPTCIAVNNAGDVFVQHEKLISIDDQCDYFVQKNVISTWRGGGWKQTIFIQDRIKSITFNDNDDLVVTTYERYRGAMLHLCRIMINGRAIILRNWALDWSESISYTVADNTGLYICSCEHNLIIKLSFVNVWTSGEQMPII